MCYFFEPMETLYPQCLPVWSFSGITHINLSAKKKFCTVAQFLIIFLFQGMMWTTYFSFFAIIGLMIPFLQLHLLEDHAVDFMKRWSTGHGIYGEQGAESIYKVFNILKHNYSSIQPASKRLESMMNEHFRLVPSWCKITKTWNKKKKT